MWHRALQHGTLMDPHMHYTHNQRGHTKRITVRCHTAHPFVLGGMSTH